MKPEVNTDQQACNASYILAPYYGKVCCGTWANPFPVKSLSYQLKWDFRIGVLIYLFIWMPSWLKSYYMEKVENEHCKKNDKNQIKKKN